MVKVYNKSYKEVFTLPYSLFDLEPTISSKTNDLHYNNHFKTYVDKVTLLMNNLNIEDKDLTELVKFSYGDYNLLNLYNNSAQVLNHIEFWSCLKQKEDKNNPYGHSLNVIEKSGKTWEQIKDKFVEEGTSLFGNGWAWLVLKTDGTVEVLTTHNAFNPIVIGSVKEILIAIDLWEHSYYIDYTFRRRDYILNVVSSHINWDYINLKLSAHIV